MDHELLEMLGEYLVLHRMNAEGRPVIEAAMRARALQELSALSTAELTRLARERGPSVG